MYSTTAPGRAVGELVYAQPQEGSSLQTPQCCYVGRGALQESVWRYTGAYIEDLTEILFLC